jgi:hypothetical protein
MLEANFDASTNAVYPPRAGGAPEVFAREHALGYLAATEKLRPESSRQQSALDGRRPASALKLKQKVAVGKLRQLALLVPEQHVEGFGALGSSLFVSLAAGGLVIKKAVAPGDRRLSERDEARRSDRKIFEPLALDSHSSVHRDQQTHAPRLFGELMRVLFESGARTLDAKRRVEVFRRSRETTQVLFEKAIAPALKAQSFQ